jgi:C1q domain
MIKVTLDNIEVSNPIDWNELTSTLKRDETFDALLLYQDGNITFDSDGYDYIVGKINSEGFCGYVSISVFNYCVESDPVEIIKGRLFYSDVEIDEYNCTVQCKLTDNSFNATIRNNKAIKCTVTSGKSKNGVDITAAAGYTLRLYEPTSNANNRNIFGVTVYEAFQTLIPFMTDGGLSFASDTFGVGGEWEGLSITSGYKIRNSDNTNSPPLPAFSFEELYKEIKRRIPIGLIIENPYTNPVLRIESLDYFFETPTTFEFVDIERIKTRFDTLKLYSKVKFGQPEYSSNTAGFPDDIKFRGWKEEEYHVLGTCNIDTALDLTCEWYTSSNTIETSYNGNEDYDEKLFLIDVDPATNTNYFSNWLNLASPLYYPNERLTNAFIAARYFGGVPNTIAAYFGSPGDGTFNAYLSASQSYPTSGNDVFDPAAFDAEVFDTGAHYDTATYKFTAPEGGVYNFKTNFNISITAQNTAPVILWQLRLQRYDNTATLLASYDAFVPNYTGSGGVQYYSNSLINTFNLGGITVPIILNTGDYVTVRLDKNLGGAGDIDYTINGGVVTYFECFDNTIGGGEFQYYDSNDYPVQVHEFEYKITNDQFAGLASTPKSSFGFYSTEESKRYAWISEIKFNHYSGTTTVKLITDKNSQSNGNRISS